MIPADERIRKHDLHPPTAREEPYGKQILLGIVALPPLRRIVVREEDVVEMDENSRSQARKDVQKKHRHVRVHKAPVRTIHKEDVPSIQLIEEPEIYVLQAASDRPIAQRFDLSSRVRVYRDDLGRETSVLNRSTGEARRISGTDLTISSRANELK
jgi:hypothetical protein